MTIRRLFLISTLTALVFSSLHPGHGMADGLTLPRPGTIVRLSSAFTPAHLKGIVIHPEDPFKFDFIIHRGDKPLSEDVKRAEYAKLVKYFLASLAIPDEDQWVNLSPYEKDRIIKDNFGKTVMGRDLLAQDYLLKQITASLIYPQDKLGKVFWDNVYKKAREKYGTTNIPVNTFNKVWIIPDDALIYEKGNTAYVLKNHLRVMLEEDYRALSRNAVSTGHRIMRASEDSLLAKPFLKEIILPELQKEINEGQNFAPLRQVYSGMLLATWFKRALKESLLGRIYANKAKVKGIEQEDHRANEEIYRRYLLAYKKGVFNFIQDDADRLASTVVPRKYFAGGAVNDYAQIIRTTRSINATWSQHIVQDVPELDMAGVAVAAKAHPDAAMKSDYPQLVMQFLERGASPVRDEEVVHRIAGALERIDSFQFSTVIPAGDQVSFISRVRAISIGPESRSNKIKATMQLLPRGQKKARWVADQILKNVEVIAQQQEHFARMDVVGVFLQHQDRKDFEEVVPTLRAVLATARKQKRPVVFIDEDVGADVDTTPREAKLLQEEFRLYSAHVIHHRPIDIQTLTMAKKVFQRYEKEAVRGRSRPQRVGRGQDPYGDALEEFFNELHAQSAVQVKMMDEQMDFETWLKARLAEARITARGTVDETVDAMLFFAQVNRDRDRILSGTTLKNLASQYKDVKPIVVILRGGLHYQLMQDIDTQSMRGISLRFDVGLSSPFEFVPLEMVVAIELLHPGAPRELYGRLVRLSPRYEAEEDNLTARNIPWSIDLIMKHILPEDLVAELRTYINQDPPVSYHGDQAMAAGAARQAQAPLPKGGIDLNASNLNLRIKRDGAGVSVPWAQQDLAHLGNLEGLDPVILSIKSASKQLLFADLTSMECSLCAGSY